MERLKNRLKEVTTKIRRKFVGDRYHFPNFEEKQPPNEKLSPGTPNEFYKKMIKHPVIRELLKRLSAK